MKAATPSVVPAAMRAEDGKPRARATSGWIYGDGRPWHQHFRQQFAGDTELVEPGRPGARHRIIAELQCVVFIADTVAAPEAARDPVCLMNRMACTIDIAPHEMKQFGQRTAATVGATFRWRHFCDPRGFHRCAGVVIHETQ